MLKWLNDKLSKGFYFPCMIKAISLLEKASLNYWAKKHVREKIAQREKTPPWVSESFQCLFLVFGFFAFIFSEWIYIEYLSYPIIVIFSYRIFEIFVFILVWIFATEKEVPLHSYRRSIASFLLNIVEVAIYFSIIAIWSGGLKNSTKLNIFYKHMVGILTLSLPDTECTILSLGELFVSAFIILVVLGALVGALVRKEVGDEKKKQ
jgi:hypothetical protein